MRSRVIGAIAVVGTLAVAAVPAVVGAQAPDAYQPIYPGLFPKPSGQNGYEELVAAVDLLASSKLAAPAQEPGAALATQRAALADPPVQRALQLAKQALTKPIGPPRRPIDFSTKFPELAGFRGLARMLGVEQYVLLADGRVGAAIDDMRTGLRIAYAIQKQTLIAGLVGAAMDNTVLDAMARHVDQLSVGDCDRVIGCAREWLVQPDPTPALMELDRVGVLGALDKGRADPMKLLEDLGLSAEQRDQARAALDELKRQDPQAVDKLAAQVADLLSSRYAAFQAELGKPYHQRTALPPIPEDTVAGQALRLLGIEPMGHFNAIGDRFTTDQARVQLLAVHAALRKYRWEHQVWPPSLAELGLGPLATDPFTGRPFAYSIRGAAYELYAAGAPDRGTDAGAHPPRIPLYLPAREP